MAKFDDFGKRRVAVCDHDVSDSSYPSERAVVDAEDFFATSTQMVCTQVFNVC